RRPALAHRRPGGPRAAGGGDRGGVHAAARGRGWPEDPGADPFAGAEHGRLALRRSGGGKPRRGQLLDRRARADRHLPRRGRAAAAARRARRRVRARDARARPRRADRAGQRRLMGYVKGLQEVGDGMYAYLQPDGGWGWSNAGLVADGERTLLIDTLFDLQLTEEMLRAMRRAVPAAASIDTLVNTHANGDHCFGNQLVGGARIIASHPTSPALAALPPPALAPLLS